MRLALVELVALPVLVLALGAALRERAFVGHSRFLWLWAGILAIPAIQLIPLPPQIWTSVPGRAEMALALELSGLPQGWVPLSLTPDKTWRSILALLPPLAMTAAIFAVNDETRRRLTIGYLVLGVAGIGLAAVQAVSGTDRFHPWETTDAGIISGFFANRNHFATYLLMCLPFAAAWAAPTSRRSSDAQRSALWIGGSLAALIIVALAVVRSRAGVVIAPAVLLASLALFGAAVGAHRSRRMLVGAGAVVVASIGVVAALALSPLRQRFESGAAEGRFENWPYVLEAANAYLPLGSGIGSFDPVYRSVEPLALLDWNFFNQAHNEYLETWLEAGWLGAALIVAFLAWYGVRTLSVWRAPISSAVNLQRAATVAIGAVLIHSAFDYPLRTETIAVFFAFSCAILELAVRSGSPRRHKSDATPA